MRGEGGVVPDAVGGRGGTNNSRIHRKTHCLAVAETAAGTGDGEGEGSRRCRDGRRTVQGCRTRAAADRGGITSCSTGQSAYCQIYCSGEPVDRGNRCRVACPIACGHGLRCWSGRQGEIRRLRMNKDPVLHPEDISSQSRRVGLTSRIDVSMGSGLVDSSVVRRQENKAGGKIAISGGVAAAVNVTGIGGRPRGIY